MTNSKVKSVIRVVSKKTIKVDSDPTKVEDIINYLRSEFSKMAEERMMLTAYSIEEIKMVVDGYLKRILTGGQLEELRLYDYTKFNVRLIEDDKVEIVPKNLFTALLCLGVFVHPRLLEGKSEYETDFGMIKLTDDGEVQFFPIRPVENFVVDFGLNTEVNSSKDIGIA